MRGAGQVSRKNVRVVWRDEGVLGTAVQQCVRMAHQILIERVIARDQDGERLLVAAAGPSRLLPCAGDAARIADQHRGVESSHVNAQFQRVCRRNAQQPAIEKLPFNLPTLGWQISGAVRLDPLAKRRRGLGQRATNISRDQLGGLSRTREDDVSNAGPHQRRLQESGLPVRAAPGFLGAVYKRGVPQDELPGAGRRPIF